MGLNMYTPYFARIFTGMNIRLTDNYSTCCGPSQPLIRRIYNIWIIADTKQELFEWLLQWKSKQLMKQEAKRKHTYQQANTGIVYNSLVIIYAKNRNTFYWKNLLNETKASHAYTLHMCFIFCYHCDARSSHGSAKQCSYSMGSMGFNLL